MPIYVLIIPLFLLGTAMSTQFTAMNTLTLADLTENNASSGNSMLAVPQQLAISFGIASNTAILHFRMNTYLQVIILIAFIIHYYYRCNYSGIFAYFPSVTKRRWTKFN